MSNAAATLDPEVVELEHSSPAHARHTPGEVGIWLLVFGEMFEFALFFGVLTYQRLANPAVFAQSRLALNPTLGMINTILLLTGSLLVAVGAAAARQQNSQLAGRMLAAAGACGLGFAIIKLAEYGHLLAAGIYPNTNDFFLYYYVFTGMHLVHLFVGMGVLAYLWFRVRKPVLGALEIRSIENGATFWHLVDLLWVALFPLLYLVS
jgi:nitric oxide reductase NorE protein